VFENVVNINNSMPVNIYTLFSCPLCSENSVNSTKLLGRASNR